jgi:hypothetical protein
LPAKRSKLTQKLRELTREPLRYQDVFATIGRFRTEDSSVLSDQAAVLIVTAMIEKSLDDAICVHLAVVDEFIKRKVFDGDYEREGILGSNYAKVIMAHALGILPKRVVEDLNSIRIIRNTFAHGRRLLELTSEEFQDTCNFNVVADIFASGVSADVSNNRRKFLLTAQYIVNYLALYAERGTEDAGVKMWKQTWGG